MTTLLTSLGIVGQRVEHVRSNGNRRSTAHRLQAPARARRRMVEKKMVFVQLNGSGFVDTEISGIRES